MIKAAGYPTFPKDELLKLLIRGVDSNDIVVNSVVLQNIQELEDYQRNTNAGKLGVVNYIGDAYNKKIHLNLHLRHTDHKMYDLDGEELLNLSDYFAYGDLF